MCRKREGSSAQHTQQANRTWIQQANCELYKRTEGTENKQHNRHMQKSSKITQWFQCNGFPSVKTLTGQKDAMLDRAGESPSTYDVYIYM